jgi:hypothetical protein
VQGREGQWTTQLQKNRFPKYSYLYYIEGNTFKALTCQTFQNNLENPKEMIELVGLLTGNRTGK